MKTKMNTEDHPEVFAAILELEVEEPEKATSREGHALLSQIGGERATQGPGNKIVSFNGKTHVVWQDAYQGRYFARVRTLDHENQTWLKGEVLMEGVDEHSRPTLAITPDGILHVIMGGHNTPLQYRQSVWPNDSSEWTPTVTFGAGTYPVLLAAKDGSLLLAVRSANHSGMELWERPSEGIWAFKSALVERDDRFTNYSAFHNGFAWGPDQKTLHHSTGLFLSHDPGPGEVVRDTAGIYQGIGYLYSPDGGQTWQRSDGHSVSLPATPKTLDLLIEAEGKHPKPGISHGGITVNGEDVPFLAFTRHNPTPGEVLLYTLDSNREWKALPGLQEAVRMTWPGYGLLTVRLSITDSDRICAVGTLIPLEHEEANWNPGIHGLPDYWLRRFQDLHRCVWLESADNGETFSAVSRTPDPEAGKGQHMPSIERREGSNTIPMERPRFLYMEGNSDYPPDGKTYQNAVYFVS